MDTEKLLKILAGCAGLLVTGGGLKTIADSWLAKRKSDIEAEQQVFDQSQSINQGLAVRIGVLEDGLRNCQLEHANCKYEMGLVRGQMLELQRQVDRNAERIEQTVASVVGANDSGVLENRTVGKMVGIAVVSSQQSTSHEPKAERRDSDNAVG